MCFIDTDLGGDRFLKQCPKLSSNSEYELVIERLRGKILEIKTWIGEYDDPDLDTPRDAGHVRRITAIENFINQLQKLKKGKRESGGRQKCSLKQGWSKFVPTSRSLKLFSYPSRKQETCDYLPFT